MYIMKPLIKITIIICISICCVIILKSCKKITEPEVTTSFVTDITPASATSGGNVTNNGGAQVTARGVCWGTTVNPTINSNPNKTTDGKGNGLFSSTITNLSTNTQYHVRAYATNSEGTGYGDDVSFITYCDSPSVPVVGTITQPTCIVTTGSVVLNGLPSAGTWILTASPGGTTTSGTGSSTTISGLAAGTTYTFTVTNALGCISAASGNVTINVRPASPSAPVVGAITQPTCAISTGSVVLSSLPSGTWTLTRTPGGTTYQGSTTNYTVTGLPPNATYTFTVTNSSGCVSAGSGNVVINRQPTAPSATTNTATGVSSSTAILNGTINANNSQTTITFEYGTSTSYGSTVNATPNQVTGNTNASVIGELTGLTANTEYHYRVKAVNCAGTNSGSDVSFTTTSGCEDSYQPNNSLETANTSAFSTLGSAYYSNTIYGTLDISGIRDYYRLNITSTGVLTINLYQPTTDQDICLINSQGDYVVCSLGGMRETIIYPITTTGYYYISVSGSSTCMTYTLGIIWGGAGSKTGTFTDYRDGKTYKWILIGAQIWMAENLNVGTRINGSLNQTSNGIIEKYCYDDAESNCNQYGGLYQWDEMMQYSEYEESRGVCPEGWHIPSDDEWKTLEISLGMSQTSANETDWRGSDEGGKLKSTSTLWDAPNTGATNASGFTALPSGNRNSGGTFNGIGSFTDFWTSTFDAGTQSVWYRFMDAEHAQIQRVRGDRRFGTPLRCVKD